MTLDLNCDLGENEPAACTRALMRSISSANIACGGHAGSVDRMEACVTWALAAGVRLGAHPGARDPGGSGRDPIAIAPPELQILLLQQVGALDRIARAHHTRLHHDKLHGALYHASDTHQDLAEAYVTTIARWWPRLRIYARAGALVARRARAHKVPVWEEVFLDRAYRDDGTLVPRTEPGAVISDLRTLKQRLILFLARRQVCSVSGTPLNLPAQTLCLHSDTPDAVSRARALRRLLP